MTKREEIDEIRHSICTADLKDVIQVVFELMYDGTSAAPYRAAEIVEEKVKKHIQAAYHQMHTYDISTTHLNVWNQKQLDLLNPQLKEGG